MQQHENIQRQQQQELTDSLVELKRFIETHIVDLNKELAVKDQQLKTYKEDAANARYLVEGNKQLIDKLLGEISKLQNDIDWYQRTYEKRSFLGTIREKLRGKNVNKF